MMRAIAFAGLIALSACATVGPEVLAPNGSQTAMTHLEHEWCHVNGWHHPAIGPRVMCPEEFRGPPRVAWELHITAAPVCPAPRLAPQRFTRNGMVFRRPDPITVACTRERSDGSQWDIYFREEWASPEVEAFEGYHAAARSPSRMPTNIIPAYYQERSTTAQGSSSVYRGTLQIPPRKYRKAPEARIWYVPHTKEELPAICEAEGAKQEKADGITYACIIRLDDIRDEKENKLVPAYRVHNTYLDETVTFPAFSVYMMHIRAIIHIELEKADRE